MYIKQRRKMKTEQHEPLQNRWLWFVAVLSGLIWFWISTIYKIAFQIWFLANLAFWQTISTFGYHITTTYNKCYRTNVLQSIFLDFLRGLEIAKEKSEEDLHSDIGKLKKIIHEYQLNCLQLTSELETAREAILIDDDLGNYSKIKLLSWYT